jgi:multiple sugar transport system permease protein
MLRTLDTFRLFDKVYALTGGGPANSTQTLSFFIYREGFSFFNFGRASAASVITLFFVAFLALFYVRKLLREDS